MSVTIYAKTKQNRVGAHVLNEEQRVEAHVLNGEQTEGAVLYTAQTLTAEEQAQARENINAPGLSDIPQKTSELENDSGFITADDIPAVPTKTSDLQNDSGFITSEDIPPVPVQSVNGQTGAVNLTNLVQDLGAIDGDAYDWDVETFLNTLQESGSYTFLWDEFKYWVNIEVLEVNGTTTVQQIFWGTEEGPSATAYKNIMIEDGEIVEQQTITYLTFQEANSAFARNNHVHYRMDAKATSVWDYCNTVALQNANPIVIYFDLSTNKTYLIETYVGLSQPIYKMQKVTEMNDISYFCQRSSYYYGGAEHWGNWFRFSGEVYTPGR